MITIIRGDILITKAEAIVNPANVSLLHGSGLCGSIHKQVGKELENYCKKLLKREIGNVAITPSFNLIKFKYIIHACGSQWIDGLSGEIKTLKRVYKNIFSGLILVKIQSVVIPAIFNRTPPFLVVQAIEIVIEEVIKKEYQGLGMIFSRSHAPAWECIQSLTNG